MTLYTLYDTITGDSMEHVSAETIMAKLNVDEESFWRYIANEGTYLFRQRYEIITETKNTVAKDINMSAPQQLKFTADWTRACNRLAAYAGINLEWVGD